MHVSFQSTIKGGRYTTSLHHLAFRVCYEVGPKARKKNKKKVLDCFVTVQRTSSSHELKSVLCPMFFQRDGGFRKVPPSKCWARQFKGQSSYIWSEVGG